MTRKLLPVVAALLLVLIGCAILWWMTSAGEPQSDAPGGNTNSVDMSAPTAPAPAPRDTMTAPTPRPSEAMPAPAPVGAPPPTDRFIVCPGNPRCPPRSTH